MTKEQEDQQARITKQLHITFRDDSVSSFPGLSLPLPIPGQVPYTL